MKEKQNLTIKEKLIQFLKDNPNAGHTVRELALELNIYESQTSFLLKGLVKEGLITQQKVGAKVFNIWIEK